MTDSRPSKKQQELLSFIDGFIKGNGYGPSYREIMRALGYKSVSTVASHVDGLIAKGYLRKGDGFSARSLEIVTPSSPQAESAGLRWLRQQEQVFRESGELEKADTLAEAITLLAPKQQMD